MERLGYDWDIWRLSSTRKGTTDVFRGWNTLRYLWLIVFRGKKWNTQDTNNLIRDKNATSKIKLRYL